jgi:hypothetical protein
VERKTFTTERGVTIEVVPIPLFLDKIRKAHAEPALPTYAEALAGGAVQQVPITAEMAATWQAEDPATWAEHAGAWAAYQAEKAAADRLLNDRIQRAVFSRAVVVELPVDDRWVRDQEAFGIPVPTDPTERYAHYIETEVVGGAMDIVRITALASGMDLGEEALRAAEDSFRRVLQRQAPGGAADRARPVDGR